MHLLDRLGDWLESSGPIRLTACLVAVGVVYFVGEVVRWVAR